MASKYAKRHYEDVAEILCAAFTEVAGTVERRERRPDVTRTLMHIRNDFTTLFTADNPLFDRERFLAACGLES